MYSPDPRCSLDDVRSSLLLLLLVTQLLPTRKEGSSSGCARAGDEEGPSRLCLWPFPGGRCFLPYW